MIHSLMQMLRTQELGQRNMCLCVYSNLMDPELGQVIQLQGDQRKNVSTFIIQAGIAKKEHIKIHGF
ncbi:hypothetical protein REPUB_Repub03eG0177600 [Reevesia pubescens]